MKKAIWKFIARNLARPRIAEAIIRYAKRTPYMHLPTNEDPSYMERYWVFNPYDRVTNIPRLGRLFPWSVRVHHIKREDLDRALHDHPWNARTIILKGWYMEKRLISSQPLTQEELDAFATLARGNLLLNENVQMDRVFWRRAGDTAELGFGEYHTISEVSDGGVYTLFISGPWQGVWGFLVDGVKIPWKTYLGLGLK